MRQILLISFIISNTLQLLAQQPEKLLAEIDRNHPIEKVYIHYDKPSYVAGETIWFKAYLYSKGQPSLLSSNFFLELFDREGHVVSHQLYPVAGATCSGSMLLADTLPQGNYYIHAGTALSNTDDATMQYYKNIYVFNKPGKVSTTATALPTSISLQFFPESGNLIEGLISVIGFKATDQNGQPINISGNIVTTDGTNISAFQSYHDGIGKLQLKTTPGKKYMAEVETAIGKRSFPLPDVQASGINLKVQDEKSGKKFQLSVGNKGKEKFNLLTVIAEINNKIVYENDIQMDGYPSVIGHIVTDSLPSGILHFTVFDINGLPLAERLSFVDNGEYRSAPTLEFTRKGLGNRAENNMELVFPEGKQRSMSVSVTDLAAGQQYDNDNIWSRFLLTSDVKGHVHNAAWYFDGKNDSTVNALDNLMLTQGWSRYSWEKLRKNEWPPIAVDTTYLLTVSGNINDQKTNTPASLGKLNIFLESEDSITQNFTVLIDAKGGFRIDSLLFRGNAKFYYAYTNSKQKEEPVTITLDESSSFLQVKPLSQQIISNLPAANFENAISNENLGRRMKEIQTIKDEKGKVLENVEVSSQRAKSKKPLDEVNEKYTHGVFQQDSKATIDNVNNPVNDKSMNAIEFIKNRIQQVELAGGRFVNRKTLSLGSGQKWLVGTFLNEQPVELGTLSTVRAKDIALVKFFDSGFVGVGSGYPGGAIAVYTNENQVQENKPAKLAYFNRDGYQLVKEFYQPDYANKEIKQPSVDNRTTLYWNPSILIDADTKLVNVKFFNNDFSKKFKIVVEGFDAEGRLIHLEKVVGD